MTDTASPQGVTRFLIPMGTGIALFATQIVVTRHFVTMDDVVAQRHAVVIELTTLKATQVKVQADLDRLETLVDAVSRQMNVLNIRHERYLAQFKALDTLLNRKEPHYVPELEP